MVIFFKIFSLNFLILEFLEKSKLFLFKDIKINNDGRGSKHCWNNKHKDNIKNFYCITKYFEEIYNDLEQYYNTKYEKLIDLNTDLMKFFCKIRKKYVSNYVL